MTIDILGDKKVPAEIDQKCDQPLTLEDFKALPKAVKQSLAAPETVKIYSTPQIETTRSKSFEFEGKEGLDLSAPGLQIVVLVPDGKQFNLQDVWLGHRNKPELAGMSSMDWNPNGAYTEVLVFDANTQSWLSWKDPKGHDPIKYAEPRKSVEYEKLGDYFGTVGKVRPIAFILRSRGKGDPAKNVVTEHSLEIISHPEITKDTQIIEHNYSPGNSFVDFSHPEGPNRLAHYGGGKSHHLKGPSQVSGGEGGYPQAIALSGQTGYETWQGGLTESVDTDTEHLDKHGRLWIKLPKYKKLRSLELSAGARWWSAPHLNPILGVHGGRKISAYVVDSNGNVKDHFMRSLNVGPQGVLMGGPTSEEYVTQEGDWIMVEGERAPSYLMGWRLILDNADENGQESHDIGEVLDSVSGVARALTVPNLDLVPTGEYPGGTQGAQWYLDKKSGDRFITKTYEKAGEKATDRCATEFIANRIYNMMGIPAQETYLVDGKVVSREIKGMTGYNYSLGNPKDFCQHQDIKNGFIVDAWLANWDVFGLEYDNVFRTKDGRMVRLDAGGTMFFRAMGASKPSFSNEAVTEVETMRNPNMAKQAGIVYQNFVTDNDVKEQVSELNKVMTDEVISALVKTSGISNPDLIITALISRRNWLVKKYLETVKNQSSIPPVDKVPPSLLDERFQDLPLTGKPKKPEVAPPPSAPEVVTITETSYIPELQPTGKKIGSSGAEFVDVGPEKAGHYLVKEYGGDVDRCATEYVANKLYQLMGIPVADARMIDGKFTSKMTPGLKRFNGSAGEQAKFFNHPDVIDGFVMDCWLANWNVFGLEYEYIREKDGRMYRTSNQGSLFFRANGGNKTQFNNANVAEINIMTNPSMAPQAGAIYSKLIDDEKITKQVEKLKQVMTDEVIEKIVKSSGISNAEVVIQILIKRRDWLVAQYL